MPRLRAPDYQIQDRYLAGVIRKYMIAADVDREELAAALCLSSRSICRRLKEPKMFRLQELRNVCKKLKIPNEEFWGAMISTGGDER